MALASKLSIARTRADFPASKILSMAEAVRWGKRGARINTISPGIVITPLAKDELSGPRGAGYRWMIAMCPVGRAGTPDEVANVAALLMGSEGTFITGSDFLMDGGVTAAYWLANLLRSERLVKSVNQQKRIACSSSPGLPFADTTPRRGSDEWATRSDSFKPPFRA